MAKLNDAWKLDVFYVDARSCSWGCSCSATPVSHHGRCERVSGFHIRRGRSGGLTLDNLNVASIGQWPGPICGGHGSVAYYIDSRTSAEQFEVLARIVAGRMGGQFEIWKMSVEECRKPTRAVISMIINGPRSGLKIQTFAQVRLEPMESGVSRVSNRGTGSGTDSNGLNNVSAETLRADTGDFRFDHSDSYGSFQETTWSGP